MTPCIPEAASRFQPFVPVVASFVGGIMAIGAAYVVHAFQAKREQERRAAEEQERSTRALKEAYVQWFTISTRFINKLGVAWISHRGTDAKEFLDQLGLDPQILGAMVRLLEPNSEARARLTKVVDEFPILLAKAAMREMAPPDEVGPELAAIMRKLAEFELWLVETRFAR